MKVVREKISDGIYLSHIFVPEARVGYLSVNLIFPLSRALTSSVALTKELLLRSNSKYPTSRELAVHLDMLWGTEMSARVYSYGENEVFSLRSSFILDRFCEGDGVSLKATETLFDCMFSPLKEGEGFDSESFESERNRLIAAYRSIYNNKPLYAARLMKRHIFADSKLGIEADGTIEGVMEQTPEGCYKDYISLLSSARVEIIFAGKEMPKNLKTTVEKSFNTKVRRGRVIPIRPYKPQKKLPIIYGKDDINQAVYYRAISVGRCLTDEKYPVSLLLCELLGGNGNSMLFSYVREKLNLCYSVSASLDIANGIIYIGSGIERGNISRVRMAVTRTVNALSSGRFSDEMFNSAKRTLLSSIKSGSDSPSYLASFYLSRMLSKLPGAPESLAERLEWVKKEDVIAMAKELSAFSEFVLTKDE